MSCFSVCLLVSPITALVSTSYLSVPPSDLAPYPHCKICHIVVFGDSGRPLIARRLETEGLGEFFGARVARRRSTSHINQVAPAPPALTWERLGDACDLCADGLTDVTRDTSPSRSPGCISSKGDLRLVTRAIATPSSWVSALLLRQPEKLCWRVTVHQETAVAATLTFHMTHPMQHDAVPALEGQQSSLRVDIHTRPGPDKVSPGDPQGALLASQTRTSRIAPRVRLTPRPESKRDF